MRLTDVSISSNLAISRRSISSISVRIGRSKSLKSFSVYLRSNLMRRRKGRRIVRREGSLRIPGLSLSSDCSGIHFSVDLAALNQKAAIYADGGMTQLSVEMDPDYVMSFTWPFVQCSNSLDRAACSEGGERYQLCTPKPLRRLSSLLQSERTQSV